MDLSQQSFALLRRDILLTLVRIATTAVIARLLGPEGMGLWIILTMIPLYAEAVGRLKVDVASVYFLGRGKYRLEELSFALNVIAIVASLTVALVVAWQVEAIQSHLFKGVAAPKTLVYLMAIYLPFHFLYLNYSYYLIHLEDVRAYNRMISIRELLTALLATGLLATSEWGLFALVVASLCGVFAGMIYAGVRVHRVAKMVPNFDLAMIKDLLRYSLGVYLSGIMDTLNRYLSGFLVALLLSPASVAFFRMGQDNAQLLGKIPASINTALLPRIAKLGVAGNQAEILAARSCRTSLLILLILGVGAGLLIKPTVTVLYGQSFAPVAVAFWILLPGVVLSGATSTLSQYFLGTGRPMPLFVISALALTAQITLALLIIPVYGFAGAAATTSFTWLLLSGISLIIFSKTSRLPISAAIIANGEDVRAVLAMLKNQLSSLSRSRLTHKGA